MPDQLCVRLNGCVFEVRDPDPYPTYSFLDKLPCSHAEVLKQLQDKDIEESGSGFVVVEINLA